MIPWHSGAADLALSRLPKCPFPGCEAFPGAAPRQRMEAAQTAGEGRGLFPLVPTREEFGVDHHQHCPNISSSFPPGWTKTENSAGKRECPKETCPFLCIKTGMSRRTSPFSVHKNGKVPKNLSLFHESLLRHPQMLPGGGSFSVCHVPETPNQREEFPGDERMPWRIPMLQALPSATRSLRWNQTQL